MKTDNKIPYSIKDFTIENFKGIENIEIKNLPKNAQWLFLTGENGFGKTSILQAIASSLVHFEPHTFTYFTTKEKYNLLTRLHSGLTFGMHKDPKLSGEKKVQTFSHLACYGSSRLSTYRETNSRAEQNEVTRSLYDSRTLLENIEYSFVRWFYKEKDSRSQERYEYVKKILKDLLGLRDIEIDYSSEQVYYIEKDKRGEKYEKMKFEDIASGYRSVIAMLGDMILRLLRSQPNVVNPSELVGIVIIDELDLHFHPKWQKKLPRIFSKHFPRIQFIASTHSPIPLLGAPKQSVFMTVDRSAERGVYLERLNHLEEEIGKLTPNLLLNSTIFGYAELFSSQFRRDQKISTEDTMDERDFNQKLKEKLYEGLSDEKLSELKKILK